MNCQSFVTAQPATIEPTITIQTDNWMEKFPNKFSETLWLFLMAKYPMPPKSNNVIAINNKRFIVLFQFLENIDVHHS